MDYLYIKALSVKRVVYDLQICYCNDMLVGAIENLGCGVGKFFFKA